MSKETNIYGKLILLVQCLWGFIAFLIANEITDTFSYHVIAMTLISSPIWLYFAFNWLVPDKTIETQIFIRAVIVTFLSTIPMIIDNRHYDYAGNSFVIFTCMAIVLYLFKGLHNLQKGVNTFQIDKMEICKFLSSIYKSMSQLLSYKLNPIQWVFGLLFLTLITLGFYSLHQPKMSDEEELKLLQSVKQQYRGMTTAITYIVRLENQKTIYGQQDKVSPSDYTMPWDNIVHELEKLRIREERNIIDWNKLKPENAAQNYDLFNQLSQNSEYDTMVNNIRKLKVFGYSFLSEYMGMEEKLKLMQINKLLINLYQNNQIIQKGRVNIDENTELKAISIKQSNVTFSFEISKKYAEILKQIKITRDLSLYYICESPDINLLNSGGYAVTYNFYYIAELMHSMTLQKNECYHYKHDPVTAND